MDETKLRGYVRQEMLNEMYGAYMSAQDFYDILGSIKDIWNVTKVAIKDVLSAAVYAYDVTIAVDGKQIEEATKRFYAEKDRITADYQQALGPVRERLGADFHIAAFLAAPGPYLMAQAYDKGPATAKEVVAFLADAGMDFEPPARSARGEPGETRAQIEQELANSLLGKKTSYSDISAFSQAQKRIEDKLNQAFGIRETRLEGIDLVRKMLSEQKESDDFEAAKDQAMMSVKKSVESKLKDVDPSALVDPGDLKKYTETKKEELKSYAGLLNSPSKFVIEIGKSKTLADVRKANELLKGTPFKISGIGAEEEKKIAEQAKQLVKDARDKKKVGDILKAIDSKIPADKITDDELYESCVVLLTKNAIKEIANMFENPKSAGEKGKKLLQQINEIKSSLIKEFGEGLSEDDLKMMEKSSDGKELAKVIRKGKEVIASSGLLS
jgi:hypothetical protein